MYILRFSVVQLIEEEKGKKNRIREVDNKNWFVQINYQCR